MNPQAPGDPTPESSGISAAGRAQLEEFRRQHRLGVLTLLFADIVGSTQLKQTYGDLEGTALVQGHHRLARELLKGIPEAEEISTAGDSIFLVFAKPSDAARFALLFQARLRAAASQTGRIVYNRIGIHVGEVFIESAADSTRPRDLYGIQVDICARVMSLAAANQILLTRFAFDNARQVLQDEELGAGRHLSWLNHGLYQLAGVDGPVEICEVGETGASALADPTGSAHGRRYASPDSEPVLGWRPAVGQVVPGTSWILARQLGEGGFGEVWLGRHRTLGEERVFKFCFRADRVRSLKREVTLFRLLKEHVGEHPNIVRLLDVYFDEPPFYIEMEYVSGTDLAQWCRDQSGPGNVPLASRLEIVAQVADALQAAHDSGIIHRDVKPSNILVASEGEGAPGRVHVKLTDFGIGRVVADELLLGQTGAGFTQTLLGPNNPYLTGTHLYMAPEVIAGEPASTRSDIYSLGVVLFQLLAGDLHRPVTTDWANAVGDPLLQEDLRLCFAGNPADRFTGAALFAARLRALEARRDARRERERQATQARRRRLIGRAALAGAAISALAVVLLGVTLDREHALRVATETARREAERERYLATEAQAEAERERYFAQATLAGAYVENLQFDRARALLDEQAPLQHRGWEWGRLQYLCNLDLLTIHRGAAAPLLAAAITADGRRAIAGDARAGLRLYDLDDGTPIACPPPPSPVACTALAFSPDGALAAAGTRGGTIALWEVETGRLAHHFLAHGGAVLCAAFSPDGTALATAGNDMTAAIWDLANGTLRLRLQGHADAILAAAFSRDGARLATASGTSSSYGAALDTSVRIWDAAAGTLLRAISGHTDSVTAVAFDPSGRRIASAGRDGTLRLWDAENGEELWHVHDPAEDFGAVAFSPDGARLVAAGHQGVPRFFDAGTGRQTGSLGAHTEGVRTIAHGADGTLIVTCSADRACVWPAIADSAPAAWGGHSRAVAALAYSRDGARLASGSWDKTVIIRDTATGKPLLSIAVGFPVLALDFSPDDARLVTVGANCVAHVWDAAGGRRLANLKGHTGTLLGAAFSPDGTVIATAAKDCTARLWDAATGQELHILQGHSGWVLRLAFTPAGDFLATGAADGEVRIWSTAAAALTLALPGAGQPATALAFPPASQIIARGAGDGRITLCDAQNGSLLRQLEGHEGAVTALVFSPDGKRLFSAAGGLDIYRPRSRDHSVKVWDVATGRELLSLEGHANVVYALALSPDGRLLASGGADSTVRAWDAFPCRTDAHDLASHAGLDRFKHDFWSARLDHSGRTSADALRRPQAPAAVTPPPLAIPARDPYAPRQALDLSPWYNASLQHEWHPVLAFNTLDNNLASLPAGLQRFNDVLFDVRGVIQLSRSAPDWEVFPRAVTGIPVGLHARHLHAIHATGHIERDGAPIGCFLLHYAGGRQEELPIIYGQEVRDWWFGSDPRPIPEPSRVVWEGTNPASASAGTTNRLFLSSWDNPLPDLVVESIDYVSKMTISGPFLVALTVQSEQAPAIAVEPASQQVDERAQVRFTVEASPPGEWLYQWLFNDRPIPNATGSTLLQKHADLGDAGCYRVRVKSPEPGAVASATSRPATLAVRSGSVLHGALRREVFGSIPGVELDALTGDPRYPDAPDHTELIHQWETVGVSDESDYGERVSGYVIPPVTGDYVFYLAADDRAALFISVDETRAGLRQVARAAAYRPRRQWTATTGCEAAAGELASAPIPLLAGRHYFVELVSKGAGAPNHAGVAWRPPGAPPPVDGDPPIPGTYLACGLR